MLNVNLKNLRKAKGLSQEELAIKLDVVRQTVSKWENGLSVPDSEMLIRLADALDTSVNVILGETITPDESINESNEKAEIQRISAKLELLNEQFARQNEAKRKHQRIAFLIMGIAALGYLLADLVIWLSKYNLLHTMEENEAIGIIGGADGPTAIMVATMEPTLISIPAVVVLVVAAIGIYRTKKK
jgi:putative transcriptional regulator